MAVPPNSRKFELTFVGAAMVRFTRYRRHHPTYDAAVATAHRVLANLETRGAHPAIIYGPGCGPSGRTVA